MWILQEGAAEVNLKSLLDGILTSGLYAGSGSGFCEAGKIKETSVEGDGWQSSRDAASQFFCGLSVVSLVFLGQQYWPLVFNTRIMDLFLQNENSKHELSITNFRHLSVKSWNNAAYEYFTQNESYIVVDSNLVKKKKKTWNGSRCSNALMVTFQKWIKESNIL